MCVIVAVSWTTAVQATVHEHWNLSIHHHLVSSIMCHAHHAISTQHAAVAPNKVPVSLLNTACGTSQQGWEHDPPPGILGPAILAIKQLQATAQQQTGRAASATNSTAKQLAKCDNHCPNCCVQESSHCKVPQLGALLPWGAQVFYAKPACMLTCT